jgi:hypothetical protein
LSGRQPTPRHIYPAPSAPEPAYRRADDDDHWLRHILENGAVQKKAPRLKARYVADRLELVGERPWKAEISGRLLSVADDIAGHAQAEAAAIGKEGIRFRYVAFIKVCGVRQDVNMDVYAEPTIKDPAHANLVAYQLPLANSLQDSAPRKVAHEFVKALCDLIQVCDAADLTPIEAVRH